MQEPRLTKGEVNVIQPINNNYTPPPPPKFITRGKAKDEKFSD